MVKGEAYESSVVVFASFVLSARGPHAGNVLEDAARVRVPHYRFLPAPAGLFHQRRRHRRPDALCRRGRGRERHRADRKYLSAICLRRVSRLLRHHLVQRRLSQPAGRAPVPCDADRALECPDRASDGASAAAVKSDARVDQRCKRQRRGLHGGLYLLRDHLCRYRRAAVL